MQLPDLINGLFEAGAVAFVALNVREVWRHRRVAGVHWLATMFFFGWGLWNVFFYSHLDQWFSFSAGICLCLTNAVYLFSICRFWDWRRNPPVVPRDCEVCGYPINTCGSEACSAR